MVSEEQRISGWWILAAGIIFLIVVATYMGAIPIYNVWAAEQNGKAALAHAHYERQVQVVDAQAKAESATSLAEAEVARAKGVAQANQIIGDSLRGHDEYLRYLWITQLEKSSHEVIYVPTEANIPILESTRLLNRSG